MRTISTLMNDGNSHTRSLNQVPDKCPSCHHAIDPIIHFAYCNTNHWNTDKCMQVIYRCTKKNCDNLFIAYYMATTGGCSDFKLSHLRPIDKKGRDFTATIQDISSSFCTIYNQALSAEQDGLKEICGVGYRKAIEFLIKDYLIAKNPDKQVEIENKFLGRCIEDDIGNENIKSMAKRATWLGNDETHYLRKWEGKELEDLKKLIDVTLYWIEMEKLTEDTISDMPED